MDRKDFIIKTTGIVVAGFIPVLSFAEEEPKKTKYKIITQRCNGCGHCYRACADKALQPQGRMAVIDQTKCDGCGDCVRYCRRMAIVPDESTNVKSQPKKT
jgi:ferredoxin